MCTTGNLNDLRAVTLPRDVVWGPESKGAVLFIGLFDWDQIIIHQRSNAVLSLNIELCTKLFPCALQIKATEFGQITRVGNGSFLCLGSAGCSGMQLESVVFVCNDTQSLFPAFQIQGASFNISNSTFTGCISITDGAVVRSYDNAVISISSSNFRNTFSYGFG